VPPCVQVGDGLGCQVHRLSGCQRTRAAERSFGDSKDGVVRPADPQPTTIPADLPADATVERQDSYASQVVSAMCSWPGRGACPASVAEASRRMVAARR
jgi:hypothetical protein